MLVRSPTSGILDPPLSASAPPLVGMSADGPTGHCNDSYHRDHGLGMVFTNTHILVKGMPLYQSPPPNQLSSNSVVASRPNPADRSSFGRIPKLHFPLFDGPNPKLWISRCENYFDMYSIPSDMWIRFVGHHYTGPAARWLRSMEKCVSHVDWKEFCSLLLERFGTDEHDTLIRKLLHIQQTGTVTEYITKFTKLIDQLTAFESPADLRHYTMKFIDGLHPDIRSIVFSQRPKDLNTTCSLASLQDEVANSFRVKDVKKSIYSPYPVSAARGAYPLPPPPLYDKITNSVTTSSDSAAVPPPKQQSESN